MNKDVCDTNNANSLYDEADIIELYHNDESRHILYSEEEIERLDLMKQISNLNLYELESLILHYRDELNDFLMDNMYISLIEENEKKEYCKKQFGLLWVLDYLRGIWNKKINELDKLAQLAYLRSIKRRKLQL